MPDVFETRLVFNTAGKAERKVRGKKKFLVVNGVLLKEGVWKGSSGSVYYSKEFIKKVAPKGEDAPIVLDHPTDDEGKLITANSEDVLSESGMGDLKNATSDNSDADMVANLWFDEAKTKGVNAAIHNSLINGVPLEVSTGFELVVNNESGEWNGQKYDKVAIDVKSFDHLAVLSKGNGACSNKKGCGINLTGNSCGCDDCTAKLPITANDASFSTVYSGLSEQLYKTYGYVYSIRDVYPKFFIYRDGNGELFQKAYTVNKGGDVAIGKDDPVKVEYVTEYRTADGVFVGNSSTENPMADKIKQHVDSLVANKDSGFDESDREFLTKKGEAWCEARAKTLTVNKEVPPAPEPKKEPPSPIIEKKEPQTLEELVANTSGPLGKALRRLVQGDDKRKEHLIGVITANKDVSFNPEWLKEQDVETLQGMAQLGGHTERVANYGGNGAGQPFETQRDHGEKPLECRRPDYSKK